MQQIIFLFALLVTCKTDFSDSCQAQCSEKCTTTCPDAEGQSNFSRNIVIIFPWGCKKFGCLQN